MYILIDKIVCPLYIPIKLFVYILHQGEIVQTKFHYE